jgi:hypothetical protein
MNIHKIELATGQRACLLDEFLPTDLIKKVYTVFDSFSINDPTWVPDPPNDPDHVRFRYDGPNPIVGEVEEYLRSLAVLDKLGHAIGKKLEFDLVKFWIDTKMLLGPHVEQPNGGISMAQIYITKVEHPFLGTTLYQDNEKILFQLPFRNNFGWFFEKSDTVMHGKLTETPEKFNRCSLMIFFN